MKELWVQELFRTKGATLGKVDTLFNWADIGTKALDKARLESLLKQMPLTRREGLEGSSGEGAAVHETAP